MIYGVWKILKTFSAISNAISVFKVTYRFFRNAPKHKRKLWKFVWAASLRYPAAVQHPQTSKRKPWSFKILLSIPSMWKQGKIVHLDCFLLYLAADWRICRTEMKRWYCSYFQKLRHVFCLLSIFSSKNCQKIRLCLALCIFSKRGNRLFVFFVYGESVFFLKNIQQN